MKKSLIALAVAGVVSAPAFAATANVDVYGKVHMSVSLFDDQQESVTYWDGAKYVTIPGVNDVQISSAASRIGFKGAEDLGGGLSAIWQIESGVNLDEQNGSWANRNSFVGLKGGFGTVLAGNHDTPLKLVGRAVDLFGDTMADSRNVMGGGSDARTDNTVAYISPSFSGLSLAAAYSTDPKATGSLAVPVVALGDTGDQADNGAYSLNATYANGPLFLGLGYGDGDYHENNGLGAHIRGAAGFTFGNFKIVGQYDKLDDDSQVGPIGLTQAGDYDAWMVGGAFTMGNVVLKGNFMSGEYDGDLLRAGYDVEQWTVGADYNLSKRTSVYALYADGENVTMGAGGGVSDQIGGAAYNVNGPITGDKDISVISVGMIHSF